MGDPIDPVFHAAMNGVAGGIDEVFNGKSLPGIPRQKTVGFVLLTFEFGKTEGGRVNYISNADRADMVVALKEFLARAEGRVVETQAGVQ